ncbi:hypothetical protein C0Q70_19171 [Pomacea canaliculata]|uniref:Uncharacterized protein n=1 Tax=Pomacea canaliculata TaxID=400727 RepID=A0A2T7NIN3_POMCA|nr:hypothetical protein C0Q70_19171 [Pomacea canaliculata]
MYGVFSVRNEPDYSLGGDGYSHYSCPNTNDDYAQVADSTDGYHHYSLAQKLVHSVQPHKHTLASSDATPVQTSDDDTQILKMSEQQAPVDYLHRYPAAH